MSTKTPNRNLALTSQTLSLALRGAAPLKKARRWIMEREDNTREGLGDNDGRVQSVVGDCIFRPVWKDDADGVWFVNHRKA